MSLSVGDLGAGHWVLVPLKNPPCDQPIPVPTGVEVIVGRQRACHISCRGDKAVSAHHCKLFHTKAGLEVEDRSTNGTYVNGDRLARGVRSLLCQGHILSLTRPPDGPHGTVDDEYSQFRIEFRQGGGLSGEKSAELEQSCKKAGMSAPGTGRATPADAAAGAGSSGEQVPQANAPSRRSMVRSRTPARGPPPAVVPTSTPARGRSASQGVSIDPATDVRKYYKLQGAYKVLQDAHRDLQDAHRDLQELYRTQGQRNAQLEQAQLQLATWVDEAHEVHWCTLRHKEEISLQLSQSEQRAGEAQSEVRALRAELEGLQQRSALREEQNLRLQQELRVSATLAEGLRQTVRSLEEPRRSEVASRGAEGDGAVDDFVAERPEAAGQDAVEPMPSRAPAQAAGAWTAHPQELQGAHSKAESPTRAVPVMPRLKDLQAAQPAGAAGPPAAGASGECMRGHGRTPPVPPAPPALKRARFN